MTPTFNRENELNKLYKSLLKQTNKDFIWLVIDDGSKDNTKKLILSFKSEDLIKIDYIYQDNMGKQSAINLAVNLVKTKWLLILDSDDWLIKNAVEIIYDHLNKISIEHNGVVFPKRNLKNSNNVIDFKKIKAEFSCSDILDLKYIFNRNIETISVIKTELLKKNNTPVFKGEKFLDETYFYYRLSEVGCFLVSHQPIYEFEYLENGWTNNITQIWIENPKGSLFSIFYGKKYVKEHLTGIKRIKSLTKLWIREIVMKYYSKDIKLNFVEYFLLLPSFIAFSYYKFKKSI
ncbi:glycosyltransferase family A protein [Vagococcus sp.]|uniref:glycosyltransferase family A protein n=1 Tax=Vagococcus sp. TaxID=1933889 RepID=UPI003F9A8A0B